MAVTAYTHTHGRTKADTSALLGKMNMDNRNQWIASGGGGTTMISTVVSDSCWNNVVTNPIYTAGSIYTWPSLAYNKEVPSKSGDGSKHLLSMQSIQPVLPEVDRLALETTIAELRKQITDLLVVTTPPQPAAQVAPPVPETSVKEALPLRAIQFSKQKVGLFCPFE